MINVFLILMLLFAGSVFLATYYNKRFEETIALSIMSIVVFLYSGAIFNQLRLFFNLALVICILLWVISIIGIIKNYKSFITNFLTPGFLIFMIGIITLLRLQRNLLLLHWDEFSHWGLAAKSIYYFEKLGSYKDTLVMYKDYPPAAALFEYFWLKITGFKESSIITSYSTIVLSMLVIGAKNIEWKNWTRVLMYGLMVFLAPLIFFPATYSAVLIDPLLGIAFSYGILSLFLEKELDLFSAFRTGITLAFLTLLKSSGFLAALFVVVFAVIDMLYNKKTEKVEKRLFSKKSLIRLCMLAIVLILPVLAQISWKLHIKLNEVVPIFKTNKITVSSIILSLRGQGPQYHTNVITSFIKAIFNQVLTNNFIPMTLWSYIVLFVLIIFLVMKIAPSIQEKKRFVIMNIVIAVYGVVYLFGLLILYLFSFSEYEALILASFIRYTNVFNISAIIILIIIAANYANQDKTKYNNKLAGIMVICLLLSQVGVAVDAFIPGDRVKKVIEISDNVNSIKEITTADDKICLIVQNTTGYEYFSAKYHFVPRDSRCIKSFSIGEKYSENDVHTKPLTPNEWKQALIDENFTYVYLYRADEAFFNQYGEMFKDIDDIKDKKLFKIINTDEYFLLIAVD